MTIATRSNYAIVSEEGYNIRSNLFESTRYTPHLVVNSPSQLAPDDEFDYIFVPTKAIASSKLPLDGYPVSRDRTTIVLVQNGIGIEEAYAAAYPGVRLLSGVAYIIASQPAPGLIVQEGEVMRLLLGPYPPSPEEAEGEEEIVQRMNAARVPTVFYRDIQPQRWKKLLFNGCYATVCAATGLSTMGAWSMPGGRELITSLGHEIRRTAAAAAAVATTVAAAAEAPMTEQEVDSFFEGLSEGRELDLVPSMLQDAQKGIEMETDVLCGNINRIAEQHGVDTPRMRCVCVYVRSEIVRLVLTDLRGIQNDVCNLEWHEHCFPTPEREAAAAAAAAARTALEYFLELRRFGNQM